MKDLCRINSSFLTPRTFPRSYECKSILPLNEERGRGDRLLVPNHDYKSLDQVAICLLHVDRILACGLETHVGGMDSPCAL